MTLIKHFPRYEMGGIVLPTLSGREVWLPVERSRVEGVAFLSRETDEPGALVWVQLDPVLFVINVSQIFAAERGLPQPPISGGCADVGIWSWLEQIVEHVRGAPVTDPWASYIGTILTSSPPNLPEA